MTYRERLCCAASLLLCGAAAPMHDYLAAAISPDGRHVASIEGDETEAGILGVKHLVLRGLDGGSPVTVTLPCGEVRECAPSSLAWTPDSHGLTFVLRAPGTHSYTIYTADAGTGALTRRLAFNGTLASLKYGADGRLAMLAIAGANKEVGAVEAGAAQTGVLGSDVHEQRIAVLDGGKLDFVSPADLFVYEYDWRPGGAGFVGTAAHGDGDKNWWVAKLYGFGQQGQTSVLYAPASPQMQIANPVVSPDGASVAFIGGLMSDFGATGGEAYRLDLAHPKAAPADLTPQWPATITSLSWDCSGKLLASVLHADQTQLMLLGDAPQRDLPAPLYSARQFIGGQPFSTASSGIVSLACGGNPLSATILQSFAQPPEIFAGPLGQWHKLTHLNDSARTDIGEQRSISWKSDQFDVQGWLLLPRSAQTEPGHKLPMITEVHGGPAWANQPFYAERLTRRLLDAGYAVFMPNPRGSFGQGEAFTRGNVRDFGYGDLRDILSGVTAAEQNAPIDDGRLGLTGWSYGGFMTMWAVTQTNRFHAAVAGAGIANWISYYGENGIDQWMIPFFGASAYDDPKIYEKSSPITFIKNVRTPTLEVVGEDDIECPAPQTEEFWHALDALGVPTQSVIYPGEGHAIRNPQHQADIENRAVAWFDKYLHSPAATR